MKIDILEKLFKSVYNKNLQIFTEINKDNFGAKIDANKSTPLKKVSNFKAWNKSQIFEKKIS